MTTLSKIKVRKPIICCEHEDNGFTYKHIRAAYALNVPIYFKTDLTEEQWQRFLDGENGGFYTAEQIERFETTGDFNIAV